MDYENIVLTEDEMKVAILEGKKKKHFHQKSKAYWEDLEKKVIKGGHVTNLQPG